MELVEDVEECVLCLGLAGEVLHVVDDKGVNRLVEVKEVVDLTLVVGGGVLALEKSGRYIKYARLRVMLLYADADGLDKVGFADTRGAEDKERVKCLVGGIVCNRLGDGARDAIAVAAAIVLEIVAGIELGVERLGLLVDERVGRGSLDTAGNGRGLVGTAHAHG